MCGKANQMKGFFNKILRINLKTKIFKEETIPDSVYETYLGGKGLGTYLLMNLLGILFRRKSGRTDEPDRL
jgi:aldehyde:ferredoxin oxidoreductase